jgi:hypothetical protein
MAMPRSDSIQAAISRGLQPRKGRLVMAVSSGLRAGTVPLLRPAVMVRAWDKPLRLVTCTASRLR